jgi:hypothetical protein
VERGVLRRWRSAILAALVLMTALGGFVAWRARDVDRGAVAATGDTTRAPAGQRIVVEVLNASGIPGQARRATFLLRDRGFDVVAWTNDKTRRERTLVVDHTGRPEAAERVARILGDASIERGDPSPRYVDVTVRLGSAWKQPPGQPYRP